LLCEQTNPWIKINGILWTTYNGGPYLPSPSFIHKMEDAKWDES